MKEMRETSKPMGLCSAAAAEKRRRLPPTGTRSFFLDPGTKQTSAQRRPASHSSSRHPQATAAGHRPSMLLPPLFLSLVCLCFCSMTRSEFRNTRAWRHGVCFCCHSWSRCSVPVGGAMHGRGIRYLFSRCCKLAIDLFRFCKDYSRENGIAHAQ